MPPALATSADYLPACLPTHVPTRRQLPPVSPTPACPPPLPQFCAMCLAGETDGKFQRQGPTGYW